MSIHTTSYEEDTEIDLMSLLRALWRAKIWIALTTLTFMFAGLLFLILVKPIYQADTKILIERRETVFTKPNDEQNFPSRGDFDLSSISSQVEVLQSRKTLLSVIKELRLEEKLEFNPVGGLSLNPIKILSSIIGGGGPGANADQRVLYELKQKLDVYSVGDSRVVSVDVSSEDPRLAAEIANAISNEYLRVQREDDRQDVRSASEFLDGEIADLRQRVQTAENRVESFRAQAGLITADEESTLTKQQLGEMLTQLSDVSGERAEAEAKAEQIRRLINSGASLDSSSEVQGSPLIQRLREQQVALKARIVDLSTSLLPNHPQVRAAQSQLNDLEGEISRQALLIAKALEGDAEIAKVREDEINRELARLKSETVKSNEQEIQLRALEREASAQRDLLETYLSRHRESLARQNSELLPVNAKIISEANVPVEIHFPKKVPTLAIATFAGFFLSSLFVLVGELMAGGAAIQRPVRQQGRYDEVPVIDNAADEVKLNEEQDAELTSPRSNIEAESSKGPFPEDRISAVVRSVSDRSQDKQNTPLPPAAHNPTLHMTEAYVPVAPRCDLDGRHSVMQTALKHDVRVIVVVPVLESNDSADFALDLARDFSNRRHTVFVDAINNSSHVPIEMDGFSQIIGQGFKIDDVAFSDPRSSVDLILPGRGPLSETDWNTPALPNALFALQAKYDYVVLHVGLEAGLGVFSALEQNAEMLVFVTDKPVSKIDVSNHLNKLIGHVPGHSVFAATFEDDLSSAA